MAGSNDSKEQKRKKKVAKKREAQDRLEKAIREKTHECTIDGKTLVLQKWSLRQGMRLSAKIANVIREAMPTGNMADIMHMDVEKIVLDNEDNFIDIIVSSVEKCFSGDEVTRREAASEWVDGLALEDGIELFGAISRLNIRPLILRLGEISKEVIVGSSQSGQSDQSDQSGSQKASQPQTS